MNHLFSKSTSSPVKTRRKSFTRTFLFVILTLIALNFPARGWAEEGKKPKYISPMHPHITSDKPGQCPVCGMDLVPIEEFEAEMAEETEESTEFETIEKTPSKIVEETPAKEVKKKKEKPQKIERSKKQPPLKEQASPKEITKKKQTSTRPPTSHASVRLSMNKKQLIGVQTEEVKVRPLFKSIRAPGRVAFDPSLYTAKNEYIEALKQWEKVKHSPLQEVQRSTREMIESTKIRLKILGLSNKQIRRLKPSSKVSEGLLLAGKGQEHWVYADVFEMHLPFIKSGLAVEVMAPFSRNRQLPGKVIAVDNLINPQTRTAKIRIQLQGRNISLRPESYVTVNILSPIGSHLAVPLDALVDTGKETLVFVARGKGKFEPRVVSPSLMADHYAAIESGLEPGDQVVTQGNFMLDSESRLKGVIKAAMKSKK